MVINGANLRAIYQGFNTIYNKAFAEAEPQYQKVATVVPSTTGEETYAWLGDIPGMREWIGDREIQNLTASDYTVKNKSFELTDTGQALLQKSVFIIQQFYDIYKVIDDVRLSNQGEIKIGIPNILGFLCYFELICEFQKKYPGIHISVSGEGTKDINAALREERLDLGIGMLSENVPIARDVVVIPLTHDEGVAVVNKSKAYAAVDTLSIRDIKDENFILMNEQYLLYDDIMQLCMQAGFTPNVTVKSSQWDFLLKNGGFQFGCFHIAAAAGRKKSASEH